MPLTRAWCLFEVLQTRLKEKSGSGTEKRLNSRGPKDQHSEDSEFLDREMPFMAWLNMFGWLGPVGKNWVGLGVLLR